MGDPSLKIEKEDYKRATVVSVVGRVDSSNAAELDGKLKEVLNDGRFNIVLNLSEVSYMSSAGLRALVSALRECKKHRGDVRLSAPSERVAEVLDLAGLTVAEAPLFQVYDDDTAAVGSF
jgi:anti-sigma B factor antagonist